MSSYTLICPICYKPAGSDHRPCLVEGLRDGRLASVGEWSVKAKALAESINKSAAAPAVAAAPPAAAVAVVAAAPPPSAKPPTIRKCSSCKQPGHTKKTCKGAAAGGGAAGAVAAEEPEPEWKKIVGLEQTFPPGRYYLSDICYSMDDELYDDIWGKKFNYDTGFYTNGTDNFGVFHTAYGDGCYRGSNGKKYGVDAGVIGIVSAGLFKSPTGKDKCGPYGGTMIEAKSPLTFRSDDRGRFWCEWDGNEVYIDTTGEGAEDEDEDDY